MGKVSQRIAEGVKVRVEHLAAAAITRESLDEETARWVSNLPDVLRDKLADVGLVPRRGKATLGQFLASYIDGRTDVKGGTATFYGHTKRCLLDYLGADKPLRNISPGDADAWRLWLLADQGLSENTTRRRCRLAKQFLRASGTQAVDTGESRRGSA